MGKVIKDAEGELIRMPASIRLDCREVWIEKLSDGSLVVRKKLPVPKGYRNLVAYIINHAPTPTIHGFTELCESDRSLDYPQKIF